MEWKKTKKKMGVKDKLAKNYLGRKGGLLSAKGGLMMGTKKVGVLSSPHKRTKAIITEKFQFVKKKIKIFI